MYLMHCSILERFRTPALCGRHSYALRHAFQIKFDTVRPVVKLLVRYQVIIELSYRVCAGKGWA